MRRYRDPEHRAFVKHLRQTMTAPEKVLWRRLRAHRFLGYSIRRQAPVGPYVVDFLCPSRRVVLEVGGDTHGPGSDSAREAWLSAQGYKIVRVRNEDVMRNLSGVLEHLVSELEAAE
jgi:very-short-patch-repair endonuclease